MPILRLLGLLFSLLALAIGAVAQNNSFELSEEDYALLDAANARSAAAASYRFEYAVSFAVAGFGEFLNIDADGAGVVVQDDSLDLQATLAGTVTGIESGTFDLEVRLVDGQVFVDQFDPLLGERAGWRRADSELQLIGEAISGISGVTFDITALENPEYPFSTIDPSAFVTIARLDDSIENGASLAHFRATLSINDLLNNPETIYALLGTASLSSAESQAQAQLIAQIFSMLVPASDVTFDQYINLETGFIERAALSILLEVDPAILEGELAQLEMAEPFPSGEMVTLTLSIEVRLSDYNAPLRVEIPAGFEEPETGRSDGLVAPPLVTAPQITPPVITPPQITAPGARPQPQRIALNEPVIIELTGTGPVDLLFQADEGTIITVTARSIAETTIDTTLEVLDANNTRLAFNDDHGTGRADLGSLDSFISELKLLSSGQYIIRVNSFTGMDSGPVEVLVIDATQRPTPAQGAVPGEPSTQIITGTVGNNQSFRHDVTLFAGDSVTITVRATDNLFDPKVALVDPANSVLADNDDHGSGDPTLGRYDSRISDYPIRSDGVYGIIIQGFAGTGGSFELTIERQPTELSLTPDPTDSGQAQSFDLASGNAVETIVGSINSFETFTHSLFARAGDVYTITVRATSPNFDPQVTLRDADRRVLIANDEHGTSDLALAFLDARIHNYIIESDGTYFIDVTGYRDSAGSFTLTIELIAQNAPLSQPIDQVFTGQIGIGEVFRQTFEAQEGDFVTITARSLSQGFDPQVALISPSGSILADNDDHGTSASDLGFLDSRIHNYPIVESGTYQIEVTGYRASAGTFAITISTIR
ncbi:MAG: hypothetical protein SNJ59_05155 [Aggregatilineales bacterium]